MENNEGMGGEREERICTLGNELLRVAVSNIGAAINGIYVRNNGAWQSVSPAFSSCGQRKEGGTYCGATIGRVSGRIAGARFVLEGREYRLSENERGGCLHGGEVGFDSRPFTVSRDGNVLGLEMTSPDGDMGFPGELKLKVRYELSGDSLTVSYTAVSDRDTVWAPTCHAYFNLEGEGDCLGNMLKINAHCIAELDDNMHSTGRLLPVEGTPLDFTSFHAIGERLHGTDAQMEIAGGYDHTYITEGALMAQAYGKNSGIGLELYSDLPAMQFYSGNFLRGGYCGGTLHPHDYFALEPQFVPNAVNIPAFASPVLRAGREKSYYIRYRFTCVR